MEIAPLTEEEQAGVVIATGSTNPEIAADAVESIGARLSEVKKYKFDDGETFVHFEENIRKRDVIIIHTIAQGGDYNVNDAVVEFSQMVQAADLASAKDIIGVLTYFGYGRQDRKAKSRTPLSAKLVSQFYEAAGANVLMVTDPHSQQMQGFFGGKVDIVTVVPKLRAKVTEDLLTRKSGVYKVAALDAGATKMAQQCAEDLDLEMVQFIKSRSKTEHDEIESIEVPAGISGIRLIAFEDVIASGKTARLTGKAAKEHGAEEFIVVAPHAQFTGGGLEKAKDSAVDHFYITDTLRIDHIVRELGSKVTKVSVGDVHGEAILRSIRGESLSEMFNDEHLK